MPHVSKKKIEQKVVVQLEKYLYKLIRDSGSQTRLFVFGELLTKTETIMLAKRLGILLLLRRGLSTNKIGDILGISPSTAERFKYQIDSGKYHHSIEWLWKNTREGALEDTLTKLVSLMFTRRTQSFKKFVDEY